MANNPIIKGLRSVRLLITRGFAGVGTFVKICKVSDTPNVCQRISNEVNVCQVLETRPKICQKLSTENGL